MEEPEPEKLKDKNDQLQSPQKNPPGSGGDFGGPGGDSGGSSTPPPAKKTPNDFIFGKLLGEGSFSSVYLAKDVKTGKEYAIKVCDKQHIIKERKAESIRREKEVLTLLSANRNPKCPFFVHLYATFQDTARLYFVVTFAHGGELLKYLHQVGSFPLPCCRFYLAEILQALRHLHSIGIVHRDLKPENILLNEHGHILVTDFGSAKILKNRGIDNQKERPPEPPTTPPPPKEIDGGRTVRSNSFVGTAQYVSPEVLKGRYSEVGPPADLWAFGCIVYQLVGGGLPFQATNEFLIFQKILKLEYSFPVEGFPPEVKHLVEKLLRLEPKERLTAEETMGEAFFKGVDFEELWKMVPPTIVAVNGMEGKGRRKRVRRGKEEEDLKPGFDPRVIAERVLRSEQDSIEDDSEEEEEDLEENGGDQREGEVEQALRKLSVAGDTTEKEKGPKAVRIPKDDGERKERLEEQLRRNPQAHGAAKGNLILKQGLVNKRKGLFARKRMLLLTEGPHLYYCDPGNMHVKGEIPWGKELRPEARDFKFFFVHTPNRTYNLEDPEGYALEWCRAINEIHQRTYGQSETGVGVGGGGNGK